VGKLPVQQPSVCFHLEGILSLMGSDTLLVWGIGIGLSLLAVAPFLLHQRAKERKTIEAEERARAHGLDEPASLHPVVDAERCIGTGSCLAACPEQDILGLRSGQAVAVSPANCIGHGLCERSCPVEAIQLVFGTEKRGVDIPRVRADFQTNVPGIYVVGELGGMGLIRNAFEQGSQCVEGIARGRNGRREDLLDVVIVGCGPAGLSAALTAQARGLRMAVLEREEVGGTVRHYPRKKLVMTEPLKIPGVGKVGAKEILKEDLIGIWEGAVEEAGLEVETGVTVKGVERLPDGGFRVVSDAGEHFTQRVILAIGRRGVPRKLGIPGEDLPNVAYSLREPEAYQGDRVLVVGGGDSAVEAALALSEQPGNEVRISYRRDRFSRIKPKNRDRILSAEERGQVALLWSTEVVENRKGAALLLPASPQVEEDPMALPNDHLFVFAGGELPTPFLERCGIQIDTKFGEP
jgi:thioredoxin reductase (NADPH)